MLNRDDRLKFSAALTELGISLDQAFVAGHANRLDTFRKEWGKPKKIYRASNGVEVYVWMDLKQSKHAPSSNVYAADFGQERAFHVVMRSDKVA